MRAGNHRFSFSRLSIQQKLPLLICALLLSAIVIFSLATYYGLKKATLSIGKERLYTLTGQLSSMLGQSSQSITTIMRTSASQNLVKQYLLSGGKEFRKETLQVLDKLHRDSTWVSIELLDSARKPVLHSDKATTDIKVNINDVLSFTPIEAGASRVGKIYKMGNGMYYPVITSVSDKNHILGYIICWQVLRTTPKAAQQLSQLMGTGATLYIGNIDGSLWTDMIKPVPNPPFKIQNINEVIEYTTPAGIRMMAKALPVANTNWLVLVQFSEQTVLEGVTRFVNWIVVIGLILTAIGIVGAWIMSRNITKPLNRLTVAASAISGGDFSIPVEVNRGDELGELAKVFNDMAGHIQHTHHELEEKVRERTAELLTEIKLRKISEEFLRISRMRYHQLVEEVKDYAIVMLDAAGNVLVWNKGAEKIKGYSDEEIIGKSFTCFYTEEDIKNNKPQQLLDKAIAEGRAEDEGCRVRKDGSKFWANIVITSIYDDEKLVGFAKITRDITERKTLEEQQRVTSIKLEERVKEVAIRTLQLETSNKELEAFSYSVSHDLRTPLRAINGYSIMLKEDYETKLDAEGQRVINNIITNAKMMGQLIDDLLAFSRLGRKELTYTSLNMQTLAENVVSELLQNELKNKYRISIDLNAHSKADPGLIKQVLMNLIGNAIKYSAKRLDPEIKIGYQEEETKIIFYIKDNGVGFNMDYANKLFGVFQRLHSQDEFEGTGVGLALVKRIIDKHKGEVWAEGVENFGATFYFSLPKKTNYE